MNKVVKKNKYPALKLNPNGSEILDLTPVAMPVSRFQSTNDMDLKLKAMVHQLLEERQLDPDQIELDDELDWESDEYDYVNQFVDRMPTKKEVISAITQFKKSKKTNTTDDETPVVRKSAKPDRAKRVVQKQTVDDHDQSESEDSDE